MNHWMRTYEASGNYFETANAAERSSTGTLSRVEDISAFDLCPGIRVLAGAGRNQEPFTDTGKEYFLLEFEVDETGGEALGSLSFCGLRTKGSCENGPRFKKPSAIAISLDWMTAYLGSVPRTALLTSRLALLPEGCYLQHAPLGTSALIVKVMQQPVVKTRRNLNIMNGLLLIVEEYLGRLDAWLNEANCTPVLPADDIKRLKLVERELNARVFGPVPAIPQLARIAAMSTTKFKMTFKCVYGLPVYQYYQKLRMIEAKKLLLNGDCTVQAAGKKVGYANLSHFAGAFKKEFGLLPSELCAE